MVYPDDIVALQHTREPGAFLHCSNEEASLNSPWRQSYLSHRGAEWGGWWKGGLTSPSHGGQWVDGVLCDLRLLYEDQLHGGTEHEGTTDPGSGPQFGLSLIHPVPDENNQIHVQINVPTLVVVTLRSGQNASSSWSAPGLRTGVPFLPSCPEEVILSQPDYKNQLSDAWFSSVTLLLPSVGVQTMTIRVVDPVSSASLTVDVRGHEAVTGLSVEPHGCWRTIVNVSQVGTAQSRTKQFQSALSSARPTELLQNQQTCYAKLVLLCAAHEQMYRAHLH